MYQDVALLLELQEMDQEAHLLQEQLNQYPAIWEEIKKELKRKTAKVEELRAAEESRRSERIRLEQDLRLSTEKIKQYQAQEMMVKTGKELSAIKGQIESLNKTTQRLEERGIQLLEEDSQSAEKIARAEEELAEVKARARKERDRIREQVNTKKKRLDAVLADREKATQKIPAKSLQEYEHVRKRHAENPIVGVQGGACMGCHFEVLKHRLVEVHKGTDIVLCDNCGRIFSQDEDFNPEADLMDA